jgi:D-3-phosphoglycerate dehydrogenase / 2-oxoglutarate reductase
MKVLVSSRSFGVVKGSVERLKNAGLEVILNTSGKKPTEDELISWVKQDVTGIIAGTEDITEKVMENGKSLRAISRYGVGMDNVDLGAAKKRGIKVCNTADAPTQAVAELTLSLMLDLCHKVSETDRRMHAGKWTQEMGRNLSGKKIGIVGLGRIGKRVIELLQPFRPQIIAYDIYPDKEYASANNVRFMSLEGLLAECDIVSLHASLGDKSRYLLSEKELSSMKHEAFIVNTARGGLIDEQALIKALKERKIAGAALDVFGKEPYSGELANLENVILTPHIGSYTLETRSDMEKESVENLLSALGL